MTDTKDLRIELRARNNALWHALFDHYESVAAFCRTHNLSQVKVGALLNLTGQPRLRDGSLSKLADQLVVVTGIIEDELFPAGLYTLDTPRAAIETSSERFVALAEARRIALPPAHENDVMMREALAQSMSTLNQREREVLRQLYGLDGDAPMSPREIAEATGVTYERVHQIKTKAMRKLRHPSRSRSLRAFMMDDPAVV